MVKRRVNRSARVLALVTLAAVAVATPSHSVAFPLEDPVTSVAQPVESDCSAPTRAGVRRLVRELVAAYNAGDLARLDGLVAREDDFQWYFVDGERVEEAHQRDTLLAYFAERHLVDDRLRLVELDVRREAGWHGGHDFFVRLKRFSADEAARGMWHGKGAADCAIFVWSIGRE